MGETAFSITTTVTLQPETCLTCGTAFGISSALHAELRRCGKSYYCPSGHSQHFIIGRTEAQRLQVELDAMRAHRNSLRDDRDRQQRTARALRGVITRTRKRVAAGICPVPKCRRHFVNLERHVATQHPGYRTQEVP